MIAFTLSSFPYVKLSSSFPTTILDNIVDIDGDNSEKEKTRSILTPILFLRST